MNLKVENLSYVVLLCFYYWNVFAKIGIPLLLEFVD
jgi:hypothetical protein